MPNHRKFLEPIKEILFVKLSSLPSLFDFLFLESTMKNIKLNNKTPTTQGKKLLVNVQKKGMPLRKPKNNGGSPIGVKEPPILLTIKMKNTI
jgi:hypothetical protein